METLSFVSKAKTALHFAAAKAERVLLDLKSDRDTDKQSANNLTKEDKDESPRNEGESKLRSDSKKWRPPQISIKQDWQDKIKNSRIRRKEVEDTDKVGDTSMTFHFYDENLYILNMKNDIDTKASEATPTVESLIAPTKDPIPSSSMLRQLAVAVEDGRRARSVKDFTASSANSSTAGDNGGLSLQAVKALVMGEKEYKLPIDLSKDEKIGFLINSLFDPAEKTLIIVGAGCSQLLSDMQAFKAASPGCILEDFVRWHSPPDQSECEQNTEANNSYGGGDSGESLSTRGQLSQRMQKGNLWRELWLTSKLVTAVKQTPLFDEDLAVEGILLLRTSSLPNFLNKYLFLCLV